MTVTGSTVTQKLFNREESQGDPIACLARIYNYFYRTLLTPLHYPLGGIVPLPHWKGAPGARFKQERACWPRNSDTGTLAI